MDHDLFLRNCALEALGLLEGAERDQLLEHLATGCAPCRGELRAQIELVARLAASAPPIQPPQALRARVLSAALDRSFFFLTADLAAWEAAGAARICRLFTSPATGDGSVLAALPAGAELAAAPGLEPREIYVVKGELQAGVRALSAGDYLRPGAADAGLRLVARTESLVFAATGARPPAEPKGELVRGPEGGWAEIGFETRARFIARNAARGSEMFLVRMQPGGNFGEHTHAGAEEIYVLAGSCHCQGRQLRVGDYHRAGQGTQHTATTSEEGCLALVIHHAAAA